MKSRPLDDIDRFELAAQGYEILRWALVPYFFAILPIMHSSWRQTVMQVVAVLYITARTKVGLSKIFRARGWDEWQTWLWVVAPWICVAVNATLYPKVWMFAIVSVLGPGAFGQWAAKAPFRKVGLDSPGRIMSRKKIEQVVADLRREEAERQSSEIESARSTTRVVQSG